MAFYVIANGQIESCKIQGGDNLYARFCVVYGKDWRLLHGLDSGTSQIARRPSCPGDPFVWNHPLSLTLK
eukprot:1346830-Amorphochlora_amoeboformis.AAC.2